MYTKIINSCMLSCLPLFFALSMFSHSILTVRTPCDKPQTLRPSHSGPGRGAGVKSTCCFPGKTKRVLKPYDMNFSIIDLTTGISETSSMSFNTRTCTVRTGLENKGEGGKGMKVTAIRATMYSHDYNSP